MPKSKRARGTMPRFTELELRALETYLQEKQALGGLFTEFNRQVPPGTMAGVRRINRKLRAWKREESPDA